MTYKDQLSCDGRLDVRAGVTAKKVAAVQKLWESARRGNRIDEARLMEAVTTTDAIFNLAHFASINFLSDYDEAPRTWTDIAGVREVPDFRPATLFSINQSWNTDGNGTLGDGDPAFVAPVIPENTPYPHAFLSGESAQGAGLVKRGFKVSWTLESQINDGLGVFASLPENMREVALDTEEADVYGALLQDGRNAVTALKGGALPSGDTVVPNAGLTRDAVLRGIIELNERVINGRKAKYRGGFNLIVPVGQKIFIEYQLALDAATLQDGSFQYRVNDGNPLGSVTVIESEYLSGTEWFIVPKKGTTRRPVLDRLELKNYRTPQLFVENISGNYVGGSAASPFEGSFDTDAVTLKLRMFGGGVVWDGGGAILYSNGTGVA